MTRERRKALILIVGFVLFLAGGIWVVHTLDAMYP
jgi:hypothetical protein